MSKNCHEKHCDIDRDLSYAATDKTRCHGQPLRSAAVLFGVGYLKPGQVHIALQKVLREEILRGASVVELSDHLWEISLGDGKPCFYSIEAALPEEVSGRIVKDDAERETLSAM